MAASSVSAFVQQLSVAPSVPGRNNFFDASHPANAQRRSNLEVYLQDMMDRAPKVLLLGEAPGFRGMRITGVPFTNRTMFEGAANSFGLFGAGQGYVVGQPLSNRTPTAAEAGLGAPFWLALMELFAIETVVAVGNVAHRSLLRNGLDAPKVRHPAHGGRFGFKRGLEELLLAGATRSPPEQ